MRVRASNGSAVPSYAAGPRELSALRLASAIPPHYKAQITLVSANHLMGLANHLGTGPEFKAPLQALMGAQPTADLVAVVPHEEQQQQEEEEQGEDSWALPSMSPRLIQGSKVPVGVTFPTNLPTCGIQEALLQQPYGLREAELPAIIKAEMDAFYQWSTELIQLGRGKEYATPVQSATIAKHMELIRGFVGFIATRLGKPILGLQHYWEPEVMASFVAMLMARNVGRGQILKHLSLAKKVSTFMASKSNLQEEKEHATRMENWLATLERQISVVVPRPLKDASALPKAARVRFQAQQ